MQAFEFVPLNFDLTARAHDELMRLTRDVEAEAGKPHVPCLLWHQEYEEVERRLVDRGFAIGWRETSSVPADAVQAIRALRIIFDVTAKSAEKTREYAHNPCADAWRRRGFICRLTPWLADFRSELLSFPGGRHDDQVDAIGLVGQLLDKMVPPAPQKRPGKPPGDRWDRPDDRGPNWKTV
jgi:hypothetical protein